MAGETKADPKQARRADCLRKVQDVAPPSGDVFTKHWTVGTTVSAQLIRHNLASGKTSINALGIGAGIAFRFYPSIWLPTVKDKDGNTFKDIDYVKPKCRATTFDAQSVDENPEAGKVAFPLFSISMIGFASKAEKESEVLLQPALVVGFLRDLVNIGVGVNATGPDKEEGDVFLLFSIGAGFRF